MKTRQLCYICGKAAKEITGSGYACCVEKARRCPGWHDYISKILIEAYRKGTKKPKWVGKGSRPEHSKSLLKLNEYGSLGQSAHWHLKARELHYTGVCKKCGKTREEEIDNIGRDIQMHNVNANFTDLNKDNWETICHRCHRGLHAKINRAAKEAYNNER